MLTFPNLVAQRQAYDRWLHAQDSFPCLLPGAWSNYRTTWLNLRADNGPFAVAENVQNVERFDACIQHMLSEVQATVGLGGYAEKRAFYHTDAYTDGSRRRDTHLGLDIWTRAGTPILATLPAKVYSLQDNAIERDYGPTLILQHEVGDVALPHLYTLYGHLDPEVLTRWKVGAQVAVGERLAYIGDRPANGNWPPHLHFQVILHTLGYEGNFPGVAFADELDYWLALCPDPAPLAGLR
ncbi:MAG: peptidase M23 [Bacteroidetes bacterium]|nr:MAG: peptidase M23 [Bacteroidota bacterium]